VPYEIHKSYNFGVCPSALFENFLVDEPPLSSQTLKNIDKKVNSLNEQKMAMACHNPRHLLVLSKKSLKKTCVTVFGM